MKNIYQSLRSSLRGCGVFAAAVLLTATGLLAGCGSNDAVEPSGGNFEDGQFVTVRDTGDASAARGGPQRTPESTEGETGSIETTIVKTDTVSSTEDGSIDNGRYSMTIPSGAVDYSTEFKITQDPNDSQIKCVLEPHNTSFNAPVVVTFDLNGTDAYLYEDVRAQRFDEGTGKWVDVPSEWDPATQILTGYFDHFCHGRAGW